MIDIFYAIKDTPIPTLLVVGGLLFLILAVAGKIAGRIEVPPAQQKWAGVIGVALLLIGITLHLTPMPLPPATLAAGVVPAAQTVMASESALPVSVSTVQSLATIASLLPTSTPPLPTASLSPLPSSPTAAPTSPPSPTSPSPTSPPPLLRSPEERLRDYWQAVSAGQYETAWNMLSSNFRWITHNNDIADYIHGYRTMALCDAIPGAITVMAKDTDYALVYATITYRKDAECAISTLDLAFHFTPDRLSGFWLIDRVDLR